MKSKAKIRVIRKKELTSEATKVNENEVPAPDEGRQSARKMVTNVSSWVRDFQKRKRVETKEALDKLFPAEPQADSA